MVLHAWHQLPPEAAALHARLLGRKGCDFRLDKLDYEDVPDPIEAAATLVRRGFAHPRNLMPLSALLPLHTVSELRAVCRAQGWTTQGCRAQLVKRLSVPEARPYLTSPCIRVRHEGLFRRMLRVYLSNHAGDLTKVVLSEAGIQRFPSYRPTGGVGMFRNRGALLAYEDALELVRQERTESQWAELAPVAIERVTRQPIQPHLRSRFDARRIYSKSAIRAVRAVERQHGPARAALHYSSLLKCNLASAQHIALRAALCHDRAGDPERALELCLEGVRNAPLRAETLALARTGKRLARKLGVDWTPTQRLLQPQNRTLTIPQLQDHPPLFFSPSGPAPVEKAVIARLASEGREAIHGESGPWIMLFGLLFYDAIFAPVAGMLPSPMMTAPLDIHCPEFSNRRADQINAALDLIASGGAPERILAMGRAHQGEQFWGARWSMMDLDDLAQLADHVGPTALQSLMRAFASDPASARSGLPDLVIMPGPHPTLPHTLILAEVKGPGDQVRDNQRCWHHQLLEAGLQVELWRVVDGPAG